MKKLLAVIALILSAAFVIGCNQTDPVDDLYGYWSSDTVAVTGIGLFDGLSTHEYNEDGTYRWDVEFTDPGSGCHVVLYYVGTFAGDETMLQITPTGGEVEVDSCVDVEANAASRAFADEEIAAASATLDRIVEGDTLTFLHEDGLERIYQRTTR
ncbi:MAG: hypothetical protein ACPG8W_16380 [Candidatus Promineifilaceae bacterium]